MRLTAKQRAAAITAPELTGKQSRARVKQLRAAGCDVKQVATPAGVVVLKKCPPGARVPKLKGTAMANRKGVTPPHLKKYLFKKGSSTMKKKKASTALVRYAKPIVITKTRHIKVPVRVRQKAGGGRSLMKREHGAGEMLPGPFRLRSAAIAGAIGYSEVGGGTKNLTFVNDLLAKLPVIGKVPREALAGLILNYFSDRGDWFDAGAQAFCDVGAYKLGLQEFEFSVKGEDDY